jgi:hypothetical protein
MLLLQCLLAFLLWLWQFLLLLLQLGRLLLSANALLPCPLPPLSLPLLHPPLTWLHLSPITASIRVRLPPFSPFLTCSFRPLLHMGAPLRALALRMQRGAWVAARHRSLFSMALLLL